VSPLPRRLAVGLNWALIVPVVAGTLAAVALGMLACCVAALAGRGGEAAAFAVPALAALAIAPLGLLAPRRLPSMPLRSRDGFAAVTLAWVAAAALGAVPFLLAGSFDRAADAFFESMSGFTTTGATLLTDIEGQPDAVLLWRSLSQWLGGVGIVVLVVAIAPATGLAGHRVFYAEASGVTADRLTPRIADTAKIIWAIYLTLSGLGLAAYWIAGMSPWEALNHTLTTVATGGFSTRNASIAGFDSLAIEIVAIVFMVAGGINFAFYWLALRRRDRLWPQLAEVRAFLLVLIAASAVLTLTLVVSDERVGLGESLRASAFTAVSIVTTTGYTTADFDLWHDFARLVIFALLFSGACAGSTAGGIKIIRLMLLGKAAVQDVQRQLRPTAVQVLRIRGRVYSEDVRRGVLGFFFIYMAVFAVGSLAMAALGLDLLTSAASAAATLNVVGPALGDVGAVENYGAIPEAGRWILSALMLIGRLEIFTVLVLLTPAFWRPNVA
jgi:trk system potassium uptake protein TrkH